MKTLTTVLESAMTPLYESLLDDFDNLDSGQNNALRDEILKGTWFRLGSDMKTIIFNPEKTDYLTDNRDVTPKLYWTNDKNLETSLSDVSVCKNLGLKFQPLAYVSDEIIGKDDDWLKYFDCEYVVTFSYSVRGGTRPTIDMSKIKFPITGKVVFTGYSTIEKIIAYSKPLEMVRFLVQVRQPITGWKCKHMIIDKANNIMFDLVKQDLNASQEEREQKLIEWVDELLKNNPDTETIYLSNFNRYTDHVKVITKGQGANRKCIKLAKFPDSKFRTLCYKNPTIEKMERDVEAWRWQHADLYECDGAIASTPGNTLGMGNPMAPTATEPGTEPIIPKHPRNKKKRKSLKESLLDDFDTLSDKTDYRKEVEEFLKANVDEYKKLIISETPNKDGFYEVSSKGNVTFNGPDNPPRLTNGLFVWTTIKGSFDCSYNLGLETLEGGPVDVMISFLCNQCPKLESLEGAPKKIGCDFECDWCKSLKTLKGAPKSIFGNFSCCNCNNLKSLKYGPERAGGDFSCAKCGKEFTEQEVTKYVDVGGRITV